MRHLIAGNWKMNGLAASLGEAKAIAEGAKAADGRCDVMLCPPATLIAQLRWATKDLPLLVGGQNCHAKPSGAHTGDISAEMLKDAGASAVIVGHSERRADHGETDEIVRAKAEAARRAGLVAIVCIGESEAERNSAETIAVVSRQLDGSLPDGDPADLVVAYEPVWAIGTGRTPSEGDIAEVHAHIRAGLATRFGALRQRCAHPLRRLDEAGERSGDPEGGGRERRARRRRQPESRGFPGDRACRGGRGVRLQSDGRLV